MPRHQIEIPQPIRLVGENILPLISPAPSGRGKSKWTGHVCVLLQGSGSAHYFLSPKIPHPVADGPSFPTEPARAQLIRPRVGVLRPFGRLEGAKPVVPFPLEPCWLFQRLLNFLNAFSQCIENSNRPGRVGILGLCTWQYDRTRPVIQVVNVDDLRVRILNVRY